MPSAVAKRREADYVGAEAKMCGKKATRRSTAATIWGGRTRQLTVLVDRLSGTLRTDASGSTTHAGSGSGLRAPWTRLQGAPR